MTKEENLKWLDVEIRTWESECQSKHSIKEALYAARKALEQEPILEKDGTLIVTTEYCENVGRVLVQYGTSGALFYQDQEPRKGHWIDNHNGTISCSSCQTWFYKDDRYSYMHYCPNCNVKMAESEKTVEE